MKATKDKDGKIHWNVHEIESEKLPFQTIIPVKEIIDPPSKLDALKEKAKDMSSEDETGR